ncbi:unnamed protein product [Allacma fusca]|nr:unnamed protein product [Allacma fusca]
MLGSLLIGLVTLIASVLTYYVYQFWFSRAAKFMRKYPGPKKVFLLGNALDLNKPNEELTRNANFEYPRKYGPRYTISVGNRNYFTSSRAKDIEKLLSSSSHINKGIEYNFVMPWLGEGLLTSKGSKWLSHRKLLTPSFHFKILEEFMEVFNGQSALFVKILGKDSEGGKKALEISQYITLCTLDIICETAMGKSMNAQREKASPYVRAIYE